MHWYCACSSTIVCTAADGADGVTSAAASAAAVTREAAPQKQRPPPPPPHVLAELRYDLYFDTHKGLVSKVLRPLLQVSSALGVLPVLGAQLHATRGSNCFAW